MKKKYKNVKKIRCLLAKILYLLFISTPTFVVVGTDPSNEGMYS